MIATIAIITCRRPKGLRRLLEELGRQQVSSDTNLDVLVVDNACESAIQDTVSELGKDCKFPLRYFEEPEPGIVAARNKCVEEFLKSESAHLIFIDDDEWPEKDSWAQDLLDAQVKYDADVVAGPVRSVAEMGTPDWAVELMYGSIHLREGQTMSTFYTGNLLITRPVLEKVIPAFDSRFALSGASDYHFSLRCRNGGYKAYYTDSPVNEDFPESRASIVWFMRRGYRSGIGFTRSHMFDGGILRAVPFCLFLSVARLLRGIIVLLVGLMSFSKLRIVSGLFRLSSAAGTLAGLLGMKSYEYKKVHDTVAILAFILLCPVFRFQLSSFSFAQ